MMIQNISRSLHGLTRSLINNMVIGVKENFQKVLEISGIGYRAQMEGNKLRTQRRIIPSSRY